MWDWIMNAFLWGAVALNFWGLYTNIKASRRHNKEREKLQAERFRLEAIGASHYPPGWRGDILFVTEEGSEIHLGDPRLNNGKDTLICTSSSILNSSNWTPVRLNHKECSALGLALLDRSIWIRENIEKGEGEDF